MVAILLLKMHRPPVAPPRKRYASCIPFAADLYLLPGERSAHIVTHRTPPVRQAQNDGYSSFRSWKDGRGQSSPTWIHSASSPPANLSSTSFSSMSSRGSWSSLFNTSNVRQLIGSSLDPTRDGGQTTEPTSSSNSTGTVPAPAHGEGDPAGIPVPHRNGGRKISDVSVDSSRGGARAAKSDSPLHPSPSPAARFDVVGTARSLGSAAAAPPMAGGNGRRRTFSQVAKGARYTHTAALQHKSVVFVDLQYELQQDP